MAAADEKAGAAAPVDTGSDARGSKLVLILTGANVAITLGMVVILFVAFQRDKKVPNIEDISAHEAPAAEGKEGEGKGEGKDKKKKTADFGKMVTLDRFTVNLSTPGSATPRFVQVNVSLEVQNDDAEHEVTAKMPQIRNVIIDLFNSKRPSDLANAEGRDYVKDEIRNALNGFMVTGKVKGVYFTNFNLSS